MSALSEDCGLFDYQAMLESPDPLHHLPVLFSSKSYQSPEMIPTDMNTPEYLTRDAQFWFGLPPVPGPSSPTVCFRYSKMDSKVYGVCQPGGSWVQSNMFASQPDVCFEVNKEGQVVQYPSNTIIYNGPAPTGLVVSGDGSSVFINTEQGWKRYVSEQTWETLGMAGAHLSTSFDGLNLCTHNYDGNSIIISCKIGDNEAFETQLPQDEFAGKRLFSAVQGSTFFFLRGSRVYTVGYLRDPKTITTLPSASNGIEGIWVDNPANSEARAIWVSGRDDSNYMSNDGGWTWTKQIDAATVGPGVFVRDSQIFLSSTESFAKDVPYPLVLRNNGSLSSPKVWENWFQLTKDYDDKFTRIGPDVKAATSPNGLFLYTRSPDGEVKLFLNVWNSPNFIKMAETQAEFAHARRQYCAKYGSVDAQCPAKKSGIPSWLVVLLVLLPIALLAYMYFSSKSRASPSLRSPLASPSVTSSVSSYESSSPSTPSSSFRTPV